MAELEQGGESAFKELDVFVAMTLFDENEDTRKRRLAATVLLVKYHLHQLFYSVDFERVDHPADDPDFYSTLATFERRAGLNVDGKFTVTEMGTLTHLATLQHEIPLYALPKFVTVGGAAASAEGTWTLQGETIGFPVNRVHIACSRTEMRCAAFNATMLLPEAQDFFATSSNLVMTDVQYYTVTDWTPAEVHARTQTACRQTTLTLNSETNQAYEVTTDLTREGCPVFGSLARPRVATLEDSVQVFRSVYDARRSLAEKASNSPMQRIRELMDAAQ